ncbi:PREDICTED: interleukin-12 subunit beta [Crocodylus porosus]|uniref:Interleukin-12 subunit beta n=1 Tax=Crocodylus porosus TaxID=8502 RepID=A0A7M4FVB8_CROPO|nr:PREDICTED: interleukin-12 subunit beta [Crocodylus porosus]
MAYLVFALLFLFAFTIPLEAKWKLRENVYVIESEWSDEAPAKHVELTCNVSDNQATSVYWMKDMEIRGHGKTLITEVQELPDAGNYTCHSTDTHEVLSYSFLLITKKDSNGQMIKSILKSFKEPNRTYLKCEAKNYSGIFICWWMTEKESPDVNFTIKNLKGSEGDVTCGNPEIHQSGLVTVYSSQCQKENHCPFAEEHEPIEMFLEVIDDIEYENSSTSFFIRDIIRPDPPQCQYLAKDNKVTWKYPKTWSTPESYFPLTFRVKTESAKKHTNKVEFYDADEYFMNLPETSTPDKIFVQARDRYYNSPWSDWSLPCSYQ